MPDLPRQRVRSNRGILVAIATIVASIVIAGTQTYGQEPLQRSFGESLEVRVVNVEAVVTDRHGNRVPGLTPDDFRLRVDGKPMPIEYFTEVREGRAAKTNIEAKPESGGTFQSVSGVEAGEPVGTLYLLFIDDFFSIASERDHVLERLRTDLGRLTPEDRVAIVSFDGRHLSLLTAPTNSAEQIDQGIREAEKRETGGFLHRMQFQSLISGRDDRNARRDDFRSELSQGQLLTFGNSVSSEPSGEELAYAAYLSDQIRTMISAITSAMRSFSGPGRKVAILLSGGWAFDPMAEASDGGSIASTDSGLARGADLYRPMVDTANLLAYTLYPVDVRGLVGVRPQIATVDRRGPQEQPSTDFQNPDVPGQLGEHQVHSTFLYLAARTGGKAMLNDLRDVALERTVEDTRSYYWLGFTARRSEDGTSHRIELKVLRPGLEVRSRKGYLDMTRDQEVTASVEGLLLFPEGNQGDEIEPLPIRPGSLERAARKTVELALTIGIPVGKVTILPQGRTWVGDLELRIASLDEDGGRSEMPVIPLHLVAKKKPSANGLIRYETRVTLRRVQQELVVAVYDPATGKLLASRLEVDPEDALRSPRKSGR